MTCTRWNLLPEVAITVFATPTGEVIGPLQSSQGYDLLMVEEFIAAELTPTIRQEIIDELFRNWLEQELNYLIHHSR